LKKVPYYINGEIILEVNKCKIGIGIDHTIILICYAAVTVLWLIIFIRFFSLGCIDRMRKMGSLKKSCALK
jgi:hypothetical protein